MDDAAKCREVGHVWVKPMLKSGVGRHDVKTICARCGLHGLGNEPLAKVFVGKVYAVKEPE